MPTTFNPFFTIFCRLIVISQAQMIYQQSSQMFFIGQTGIFNMMGHSTVNGSTWKLVNLPTDFFISRQGHHEPFHMTTSWQKFRIPDRNTFAIYLSATAPNSTRIEIQLKLYKYQMPQHPVDDIEFNTWQFTLTFQKFGYVRGLIFCGLIDLRIDPGNGYNYTVDLADVDGSDISIIKLNPNETQISYSFQHIYLQSSIVNQNKFSLSASFTVLNQTLFNVQIKSKYALLASNIEIKLLIYNKNEFLANGYKNFQYKVTFGALENQSLTKRFPKGDAPPSTNFLFGLQDFDVIQQRDIGFAVGLIINTETNEYQAMLNSNISGSSIQTTTFYGLFPTIINCPDEKFLVNSTFTECYKNQCPLGMFDTRITWGQGVLRLTICDLCISPCNECSYINTNCTTCQIGYFLEDVNAMGICSLCSILDGNCLECVLSHCTKCTIGYVDFSHDGLLCERCSKLIQNCVNCTNYITGIVCKKCSLGYGLSLDQLQCINCNTIFMCLLCSNATTCTQCRFPYVPGISGLCDRCAQGYNKLDQFCVQTPGCQNAVYNSTTLEETCLVCMAQYNFEYLQRNQTCVCKYSYKLSEGVNKSKICKTQCGDGILTPNDEECDDSNLINDDGCDQNCKVENQFACTQSSPSQCTLNSFKLTKLDFNYVIRIQGTNRARFSFTIFPDHSVLKYLNWQSYFSMNLSAGYVDYGTFKYGYNALTNEVTLEVDYLANLEDLVVNARLKFSGVNSWGRRLSDVQSDWIENYLLENNQTTTDEYEPSTKASTFKPLSSPPVINSTTSLSIVFFIEGANAAVIYESPLILKTYQASSIISIILTVLLLIQFFIGSYTHKMIGIETLQIFQILFFVRMIVSQNNTSLMNSFNVLKYTAYGGYENFAVIYNTEVDEVQALTYMTVQKNFVYVGLMKFLSCNINFSLIPTAIVLIVFIFKLIRKFKTRNEYIETRQQSVKDVYTVLRRKTQFFYDHFVFPFIMVFNMIIIFCTTMYLQQSSAQPSSRLAKSEGNKFLQVTGFIPHLLLVFLTFFLYCFEAFLGYDEWQHSRKTDDEKRRVPKSMVERLQHDENNPDRANYKPGYSLFYLMYFLVVEIMIMLTVMVKQVQPYGLQIIIGFNLLYLAFIWWWNPYCAIVNFHNKALRLNHITVIVFLLVCEVFQQVPANPILYVFLMVVVILLMTVLTLFGYLRIYVQYKFRKALNDDNTLLNSNEQSNKLDHILNDKMANKMTKRQALLKNNPFLFENQIKKWMTKNELAYLLEEKITYDQMKDIKMKLMNQLITAEREIKKQIKKGKLVPDVMEISERLKKEGEDSPNKEIKTQSTNDTGKQRQKIQKVNT